MEGEAVARASLAAWVMLIAYATIAAVILPREINWLKSVDEPDRTRFIVLDVLIQVFIMAVLLPPALSQLKNLSGFIVLLTGFVGLWVVVIWTSVSRYRYISQYLASQQDKLKKEFVDLEKQKSKGMQSNDQV